MPKLGFPRKKKGDEEKKEKKPEELGEPVVAKKAEEKEKPRKPLLGLGRKKAEKKEKEKGRGLGIALGKKGKEEKPRAAPSEEVLEIKLRKRRAVKKRKPRRRRRSALLAEIYRIVISIIIEGILFGGLAATIIYVMVTGLVDSPLIAIIAGLLGLDNETAFLTFIGLLIPVTGFLAADLATRSQRGISLVGILTRRGRPVIITEERRTIPLHPGRVGLAGLSLLIPATGVLLLILFPVGGEVRIIGSILTAGGIAVSLWLFVTAIRPAPPLPWYVSMAVELRAVRHEETEKLAQLLRTAGATAAPSMVMARYITLAVVTSFLLIPIGVFLAFAVYYQVLPLDIALAGVALFALILAGVIYYPYIKFSQLRGERKRLVERDLPFFAIYASILQSAGLFIDKAFRRMIGNLLLPGIEREGRLVEKDLRLGKDPLEAVTELARHHPSRKFRDFVFGYTAVVRSGWDALAYLTTKVREYIQDIKFDWRMYSERAGSIGEMLIILFFMSSTMFIMIAVVLPYGVEGLMMVFNFLILPMTTVLMISMIDAMIPQPKIKNYYTVNILMVAATPLLVLIALLALEVDPVLALEATFISALLAVGIDFHMQHSEVKDIEDALPEFLRDITEYRKIGFPLVRAFFMIQESGRKYNKHFDKLLSVITAQLRAGIRLNRVRIPTRSWLGRFTFWLLGEIEDTGGGTPAIMEEFTGLITDILDSRENARRQLRVYNFLAYLTPFFLAIFVAMGVAINNMIKDVLSSMEQAQREFKTTGGISIQMPIMLAPADAAIFHAKISVFVSSLLLALAMTKAVDLTVRNTIRVAIISAMALIIIYYVDWLGEFMMQQLLST